MTTTIETVGRRHYLRNLPFAQKDEAKSAGCRWDADARAWWTGTRTTAEAVLAAVGAAAPVAAEGTRTEPTAPGMDATIAGRATYRGHTYYIAGRVVRGRTHWDDSVSAVESRDGSRVLLIFRDGSSQFWAARAEVAIVQTYDRASTIRRVADYAAQVRDVGGSLPDDGYVRGGEILIRGCGECSRLGRMCASCAHDAE